MKYIALIVFLVVLFGCVGAPANSETDNPGSISRALDSSDDDDNNNNEQDEEDGIFSGEGVFFKHEPKQAETYTRPNTDSET